MGSNKLLTIVLPASVTVAALIAIGVGMYYAGYEAGKPSRAKRDVAKDLMNEITASGIDTYLKELSSVPHLAGTAQDFIQADAIRAKFESFGLDRAFVVPYNVLLSYPNMTCPNKLYVLDAAGNVAFNTSGRQEPLFAPEEQSDQVAPNFNAYSATGTVQSEGLVYVYYGRESDYEYLESKRINVSGKIVLARYGASFRANIVDVAQKKGAVGVLLYSDPQQFAQEGRNRAYPDTWWMPGLAVQSGTVYLNNGDPLTPFYPSVDGAYYINEKDAALPKIPVQPIGYVEAEELFARLKAGEEAPPEWRGNLSVKYYLGPELATPGWTVKLEVLTANKMATIYNTIGILEGEEEPDRYVLMGNHRDAWVLGALDPSSGTACMLEMARSFGAVKQSLNWRPRRTLVFCSWGAEEYGLIGSYEWVEQYAKVLGQRAIAYLNVDIAVEGNYSLWGSGAPLMNSVYLESAKKIPNPDPKEVQNGRETVYDTWIERYPDKVHTDKPTLNMLGSGSDYTAFMHYVGIPSVDIRYTYQEDIGSYPLYHTLYETHYLLASIMDKGFVFHRSVAQLWAEMARNLTESIVLPLDLEWYAIHLKESFDDIQNKYGSRLESNGATLKYFETAVSNFNTTIISYRHDVISKLDENDLLAVRRVNDQLMQLERHFIDPHGLPNRPDYNHIVFAPSASDGYDSSSFAGLTDLLEAVGNQTEQQRPKEWAQIKQHLSVIAFLIDAAGKSLSDHL